MGAEPPPMALSPDQLNDTDERVLDVMREGRATPQYVADQLDLSRPYASDRLKRLVEHGHVEKLAAGLYELADDPRSDGAGQDDVDAADVAKLKTDLEATKASREQIVDERDELRERVDELEEQLRGDAIDVDRARQGVDAAKRALEGQSPDVEMAVSELEAAQEVLEDG